MTSATDVARAISPTLLEELEAVAADVALACGALVRDERPADLGVHHTKASATDVVTEMDARSEQLAAELLRRRRPDDGQYGEEGLRVPGSSAITWVVDPIDGTVNYLYGIPAWAVSVAAVVGDPATDGDWHPVAGAVFDPSHDELFVARRGAGARLRRVGAGGGVEEPLRCSPPEELARTLLATGFAYEPELREAQGRIVASLLPRVRDIRRGGSAALDLCHVGQGQVDAYYEHWLKPWDMAAGWLVAAEAGATVTTIPQPGLATRLTVAGGAGIVEALLDAATLA